MPDPRGLLSILLRKGPGRQSPSGKNDPLTSRGERGWFFLRILRGKLESTCPFPGLMVLAIIQRGQEGRLGAKPRDIFLAFDFEGRQ